MERIGPVFCQLYGQTECAGIITSLWRHQHDAARPERLASCGQAMPGVRVSIRDDAGDLVPQGTPGEVCVQGPSVMKGYLNQPELTAEALAGGWLHTGDVATADDEGFYYLVDRKKDMIVTGGFNVFPSEIEKVLAEDPAVAMVAVVGVPDAKWGEAVKALVVARPGATVDADRLVALAKQRKGSHYAPKSVEVVDSLPVTAVGKLDKKSIRDRYWSAHERKIH
jgi:fatty-acyl-CoA synthase